MRIVVNANTIHITAPQQTETKNTIIAAGSNIVTTTSNTITIHVRRSIPVGAATISVTAAKETLYAGAVQLPINAATINIIAPPLIPTLVIVSLDESASITTIAVPPSMVATIPASRVLNAPTYVVSRHNTTWAIPVSTSITFVVASPENVWKVPSSK